MAEFTNEFSRPKWQNIRFRLAEFTHVMQNYCKIGGIYQLPHTSCVVIGNYLKYKAPKSLKDELLIAKHRTSLQLFNYYNKDSKRQQINRNNLNKRSYLMLCTVQLLDKMYIIIIFIQIRELNLSPSLKSAYSPVLEG